MPAVPASTNVHSMINMPAVPVFGTTMPPNTLNCTLCVVNILHLSREGGHFVCSLLFYWIQRVKSERCHLSNKKGGDQGPLVWTPMELICRKYLWTKKVSNLNCWFSIVCVNYFCWISISLKTCVFYCVTPVTPV